jgi:hypothetical protein
MFLEALIPRNDLRVFLARALPMTILLDGVGGSHALLLSDLGEVTIVPEKGVRLVCKAHLHWPVLGIDAPLTLNELSVLLIPEVREAPNGETLVFRITLEHLDIHGVPGVFDETIARAVNERIAASQVELAWDFSTTFANVIPLPPVLAGLDALALHAAWGKVKMTEDAVGFALSLHTEVVRAGEARKAPAALGPDLAPHALSDRPKSALSRPAASTSVIASAALFGLAAGVAFFGLRRLSARW